MTEKACTIQRIHKLQVESSGGRWLGLLALMDSDMDAGDISQELFIRLARNGTFESKSDAKRIMASIPCSSIERFRV
jgi:hypothetical protein